MKNLWNAVKRCASAVVDLAKDVAREALSLVSKPVALASTGLALAGSANAAVFELDVTEIVETIAGAVTVISAVGLAILSMVVVIKLFKWVQRVL